MAFEDRCSPNQANSPGPDPNKSPSSDASNLNPNDRPLKPYTCNIITKHERSSSPIDGMTLKKASISSPIEEYKNNQIFYNPYYVGYYNIYDPLNQYLAQKAPLQEARQSPPQREERPVDLNFSISNILRPEFGLTAIKKTTNKKEGPRSGGPTQSILYKPYELAKSESKIERVQKIDSPTNSKYAPLGRLTRAVASIPQTKKEDFQRRVSKEEFGFSKADTAQKRPDSANSTISTASSSVSSQGVAQGAGGYATGSDEGSTKSLTSTASKSGDQQWPAWVFCTRYSDRPSSGESSIDPLQKIFFISYQVL